MVKQPCSPVLHAHFSFPYRKLSEGMENLVILKRSIINQINSFYMITSILQHFNNLIFLVLRRT